LPTPARPLSEKEKIMPTKYVHANLVAKDWRRLAAFYREVFGCVPVPPERDLSGDWLDKLTGIRGGAHLRDPSSPSRLRKRWTDSGNLSVRLHA
jgi:hypothetical protein